MYQILSKSPSFIGDITENILVSFPDTVFEIVSVGPRNDRSGADIDILGPRNAFFGFDGAPARRSGAFRLTFTTDFTHIEQKVLHFFCKFCRYLRELLHSHVTQTRDAGYTAAVCIV